MERINDNVVNAAWNLFGLTGGVKEYLLYKDIKNKCEDKHKEPDDYSKGKPNTHTEKDSFK